MNVTAQVGDTLLQASGASPLDPRSAKRGLRGLLRQQRKSISPPTRRCAGLAVARLWRRCQRLRAARRVAVYLAMGSELPTKALIATLQAHGIAVYAPAIGRQAMGFRRLGPQRLQAAHALGMLQPVTGTRCRASAMDVVVLPLLGFDANGTRLGQGGGYYDRSLSANAFRPYRLGLAYSNQEVDALPVEPWDQPLNAVLTERGLQHFRRRPAKP